MAAVNIVLIDIDGPPPSGGGCKITADIDTVAKVVTAVHFVNSTATAQTFKITEAGNTQTVALPAGTPLSTITPPFPPGNWTPTAIQNPATGRWAVNNAQISLVSQ